MTEPQVLSLSAMADGLRVLDRSLGLYALGHKASQDDLAQAREHLKQAAALMTRARNATGAA